MITDTKEKILRFIEANAPTTIKELEREFGISRVMIHKHIVSLLESGKIHKKGSAPKVMYFPTIQGVESQGISNVSAEMEEFFGTHFLSVSPNGQLE